MLTATQANEGPVIHIVHFCEDINAVILGLFSPLDDDLQGYGIVELWVAEAGDWHSVSTSCIAVGESFRRSGWAGVWIGRTYGAITRGTFRNNKNSNQMHPGSNTPAVSK